MSAQPKRIDNDFYSVHEWPFEESAAYVRALVENYPGTYVLDTGASRIARDVCALLPAIAGFDQARQSLSDRIAQCVYPYARNLLAGGVHIKLTISDDRAALAPPTVVGEGEMFAVFDTRGAAHCVFLPPYHVLTDAAAIAISSGLAVECIPVHKSEHQLEEYRGTGPGGATSNLPNRIAENRFKDPIRGYEDEWPPLSRSATFGLPLAHKEAHSEPAESHDGEAFTETRGEIETTADTEVQALHAEEHPETHEAAAHAPEMHEPEAHNVIHDSEIFHEEAHPEPMPHIEAHGLEFHEAPHAEIHMETFHSPEPHMGGAAAETHAAPHGLEAHMEVFHAPAAYPAHEPPAAPHAPEMHEAPHPEQAAHAEEFHGPETHDTAHAETHLETNGPEVHAEGPHPAHETHAEEHAPEAHAELRAETHVEGEHPAQTPHTESHGPEAHAEPYSAETHPEATHVTHEAHIETPHAETEQRQIKLAERDEFAPHGAVIHPQPMHEEARIIPVHDVSADAHPEFKTADFRENRHAPAYEGLLNVPTHHHVYEGLQPAKETPALKATLHVSPDVKPAAATKAEPIVKAAVIPFPRPQRMTRAMFMKRLYGPEMMPIPGATEEEV